MSKGIVQKIFFIFRTLTALSFLLSLLVVSACRNEKKENNPENESDFPVYFHADNDIAMTIRSLVDALRVGEPIDSVDYDFTGILTDGQGAPLYTDLQGSPGVWIVDVLDTNNVSIKNVELGDLLPGHLTNYILESLDLPEECEIAFQADDAVNGDDTEISIFDFGGGYLRFETRHGEAPNGLQGPYITIILSSEPPASVEIQKAV